MSRPLNCLYPFQPLLYFGWFIIFNGTKDITSSNEAKAYVKDYTDLISLSTNESFDFEGIINLKRYQKENYIIKK